MCPLWMGKVEKIVQDQHSEIRKMIQMTHVKKLGSHGFRAQKHNTSEEKANLSTLRNESSLSCKLSSCWT